MFFDFIEDGSLVFGASVDDLVVVDFFVEVLFVVNSVVFVVLGNVLFVFDF